MTVEIQVMITEPFWKISKKLLKLKKRWDLKLNSSNAKLFPCWYNWKTTIESFSIFPKTLRRYQNTKERWTYHEHIILGSPLGTKSQADLLERKIKELEKVNEVVETLDSHYGFLCWKIASVWQTCCTSWESVNVLIIHGKLCQNRTRRVLMCVMWTSTLFRVLSWLCPLGWVVLGFHPHQYQHFPPFWPQLLVPVTFSRRYTRETFEDVSFKKRLQNGWVWRNNSEVLSIELRKLGHNLSTSKQPKIWFLQWMTNLRKFSTLIKQIRVSMAERCSLQGPRRETWWSANSSFN